MAMTAKVAERVDLLHVWLIESSLKRTPGTTEGLSYTTSTEAEADVARDPDRLFLLEKFSLKAVSQKKKGAKPIVDIQATFLLTYELKEPEIFPPAHFLAFARMNGIYNAWPYWREYVQNVTGRMGLPPLTLPVFRLSDLKFSVGPTGKVVARIDQWQPEGPVGKSETPK